MRYFIFLTLITCLSVQPETQANDTAIVAVASNLSHAVREIGNAFTMQTQQSLKFSFGSSGNLAQQIAKGSPHELFLSANTDYIKQLQRLDKTIAKPIVYAKGRLCLFLPRQSKFYTHTKSADILRAIQFDKFDKMTIANPKLAPYGKAAFQTLQSFGVWGFNYKKIALAENITQATQFSLTQSVDMGFIPYSHASIQNVKQGGKCLLIAEHLHQPIEQSMILTRNASETAHDFFDFMISNHAQDILMQHGYQIP